MKKLALFFVTITVVVTGLVSQARAENPVVIELFTSEGCSSCPPADALLIEIGQKNIPGVQFVLLGEHVDYWDHDGWKDRFSSAQFTQRQGEYAKQFHLASVYSPQIVIDGHLQAVGNKPAQVSQDLQSAAAEPKPAQVSLQWQALGKLHVAVHGPAEGKPTVMLAVTEDGLSTSIRGGENSGRTLQHAAVVRELRELGAVHNGRYETDVNVASHPDWNRSKLKAVVLVQQPNAGKILGAATVDFQAQ